MNEHIQQMMDVATGVINGLFITTGKPDVHFKQTIELTPGGAKNLLVLGSVHRNFEDGFCIAVLNPDDDLAANLDGGIGYPASILKEIVSGRCKAMVQVMCTGRRTFLVSHYRSREL